MKFIPLYGEKPCDEWARDTPGGSWGAEIGDLRRPLIPAEKENIKLLPEGAHVYALSKITSAGAPTKVEPIIALGKTFELNPNEHWKTSPDGIKRLEKANRLECRGRLWFTKFYNDGQFKRLLNVWTDTAGKSSEAIYVVQTQPDVIARCMLMTTDPGDLVLDPTCGSGTTAYVAEQWGRRWITCDSSRVALVLAKHRLLTAKFDFYKLRELNAEDVSRNPKGTWIAELNDEGMFTGRKVTLECKLVPHITLKSIARNASLDPIFARHEPILAEKLERLNREVRKVSTALKEEMVKKLIRKHREEGANAITDADTRRCLLPDTHATLI
jgi:adenine-specific DNA-methyltransferase